MWKKVLYIGIAIIFGIIIFLVGYISNQVNHISDLVTKAIKEERYEEIPRISDALCFNDESLITDDGTDKMELKVYSGLLQQDISYTPSANNTINESLLEEAYYFYIFNPKFTYSDVNSKNYMGVTFSNDQSSYTYYFIVDGDYNSQFYKAAPTTKEEAILNKTRNSSTFNNWGYYSFALSKSMSEFISNKINGDITSFTIIDSEGISVASYNDLALDFSQPFFIDQSNQELIKKYADCSNRFANAETKEEKKAAQDEFNTFYSEYLKNTPYTIHYTNNELLPSSLVWKTIGMEALYVIFIAFLYILLFHFRGLKALFSRSSYKDYKTPKDEIIINGKKVKINQNRGPKSVSEKEKEPEVLPDTTVDETLEIVTAHEVIQAEHKIKDKEDDLVEEPTIVESLSEENTKELVEEPIAEEQKISKPAQVDSDSSKTSNQTLEEETKPAPKKKTTVAKKSTTVKKSPTAASKTTTAKKSTATKSTTSKTKSTEQKKSAE
ncbi:MAG: hypothetical protein K2I42_07220 [Anaeroplasmataceae bacterium]|nr:hypothetical protein [Anaeroplasmataceae bacterium]